MNSSPPRVLHAGISERFPQIEYSNLSSRQKENFNFQKLSSILADYGFVTIRLTDDWNGADLLAHHTSGETIKVQLKSRLGFFKKYCGRGLWVAFRSRNGWFMYPHDELLVIALERLNIGNTESWINHGHYHWNDIPKALSATMKPFLLPGAAPPEEKTGGHASE